MAGNKFDLTLPIFKHWGKVFNKYGYELVNESYYSSNYSENCISIVPINEEDAKWFAQEKDLVGIKKESDDSCEYILFYNNHGSLNEKTELSYHTPITDEIDNQMIDGYIYSISDLLTYNAPCKIEK